MPERKTNRADIARWRVLKRLRHLFRDQFNHSSVRVPTGQSWPRRDPSV